MPGQRGRRDYKWLIAPVILISLALFGLYYHIVYVASGAFDWTITYKKLIRPLLKLVLFLGIGLFAGILIESLGWTTRIAQWIRPMTTWGHLKDESGAAFVTSFVSGITSNAMLMEYYRGGRLTRKELVLTYLLNNGIPVYVVHLPTTFFIVSLLAGTAGLIYILITFLAALLRSMGILIYTRLSFKPPERTWSALVDHLEPKQRVSIKIWNRFKMRFVRLVLYTIPIFILIFLINEWGGFQILRKSAVGFIPQDCFPVEAVGLVIFSLAAEFSSGMTAAGVLLQTGTLTVNQTALALIAGNIISTPIRAIRHQLPAYAGLFDLGLGSELLLLSQFFRIISLLAITIPYAVLTWTSVCTITPVP